MYSTYDDDRASRIRTIDLGNNKIFMKQTDPFGLIEISFERGQIPEELSGRYTGFDYARRKIETYLNNKKRGRVVTDVELEAAKDQDRVENIKE
jgi:hypothetical protein